MQTIAKHHDIHVLTAIENRQAIEQVSEESGVEKTSFTFFGNCHPYHENRLIARIQSWQRYRDWVKDSLPHARRLHAIQPFDLIHHITYSSWRIPSPLWQLGPPLVWGPVGGVAEYPTHLLSKLSKHSAAFEIFRNASNKMAFRSGALRRCVRNAKAVVASNRETFDKLSVLRRNHEGLHILFPAFFSGGQMASFHYDPANKSTEPPLRLFAGGSLIGSKGIIFALEAVKIARNHGVSCHFLIASGGPEVPFLKHQAQLLGLEDSVEFHLGYSGEAYRYKLKESHVFLLPSFRENAPGTILEAMLAGCVPVVVDASAQGDIVQTGRGLKVLVRDAEGISRDLADCLVTMYRQPETRIRLGRAARDYVSANFTEARYINGVEAIYRDAIAPR